MTVDTHEILQKIEAHLESHTNATLQSVAETLGIPGPEIEQILNELEHKSFHELREKRRLSQAFNLLSTYDPPISGPWKEQRARPRIFVPWTTIIYSVHNYGICENSYSNPCPVASLNIHGLAFLADQFLKPGNLVSLLLTLPEEKESHPVKGYIIYSIETDIAGYCHRMGIQFLPFAEWKGCNSPKVLDVLAKYEKDYQSS
jgi:AraC-like DNA-binding protein